MTKTRPDLPQIKTGSAGDLGSAYRVKFRLALVQMWWSMDTRREIPAVPSG